MHQYRDAQRDAQLTDAHAETDALRETVRAIQADAENLLAALEELLPRLRGTGLSVTQRAEVAEMADALRHRISNRYSPGELARLLPTPEERTDYAREVQRVGV